MAGVISTVVPVRISHLSSLSSHLPQSEARLSDSLQFRRRSQKVQYGNRESVTAGCGKLGFSRALAGAWGEVVGSSLLHPPSRRAQSRRGAGERPGASVAAVEVVEIKSEEEFASLVLKSDLPVLVDFWATWCGPCKLVAPLMKWAAEEYPGTLKVVKLETDAVPAVKERYKVYGLPTLIIFQGGEEVPGSHYEGAITKAKLKDFILSKLPQLAPS